MLYNSYPLYLYYTSLAILHLNNVESNILPSNNIHNRPQYNIPIPLAYHNVYRCEHTPNQYILTA